MATVSQWLAAEAATSVTFCVSPAIAADEPHVPVGLDFVPRSWPRCRRLPSLDGGTVAVATRRQSAPRRTLPCIPPQVSFAAGTSRIGWLKAGELKTVCRLPSKPITVSTVRAAAR